MKKLISKITYSLKKSHIVPVAAVIGMILFWGTSNVSTKLVLNSGVSPVTVIFLRFLFSSAILLPILYKLEPNKKIKAQDRLWFILNGLFGGALYYYFESIGIKLSSAGQGGTRGQVHRPKSGTMYLSPCPALFCHNSNCNSCHWSRKLYNGEAIDLTMYEENGCIDNSCEICVV